VGNERLLPLALRARPAFVLARLAALARQECGRQLAEVGLSQHQHAILCCLDEYGSACQKEIATRLGIDAGDIVAFIDGLQGQGLVARERDQRDRRRQILTITPSGKRLLRKVESSLDKAEPGVLAALSPEQRAAVHQAALKVLAQHDPAAWGDGPAAPPEEARTPASDG